MRRRRRDEIARDAALHLVARDQRGQQLKKLGDRDGAAIQLGVDGDELHAAAEAVWSNLNPDRVLFTHALSVAGVALQAAKAVRDGCRVEIGWCDVIVSGTDLFDMPTAWDVCTWGAQLVNPGRPIPPEASSEAWETPATINDTWGFRKDDTVPNPFSKFWLQTIRYLARSRLTRTDLRAIITRGLQETTGNYKLLVPLFGMPQSDYKRFLNLLSTHGCTVDFREFRSGAPLDRPIEPPVKFPGSKDARVDEGPFRSGTDPT